MLEYSVLNNLENKNTARDEDETLKVFDKERVQSKFGEWWPSKEWLPQNSSWIKCPGHKKSDGRECEKELWIMANQFPNWTSV